MKHPLTAGEAASIRQNLFPPIAADAVAAVGFPWHRDLSGRVTASRPRSSQALAVSVFQTVSIRAAKDAVLNAWAQAFRTAVGTGWSVGTERLIPKTILGEPRPSQIDAWAETDRALLFFECKFTESSGGGCSQVLPLRRGEHAGMVQCDGSYRMQMNPVNGRSSRCALTPKGVRYWERIPSVLAIDPDMDHVPCPFNRGWFQWMRNLVACAALAAGRSAAAVVLYADGPFAISAEVKSENWARFTALAATGRVALHAASYQELLRVAAAAASRADLPTVEALQRWVDRRIAEVAAQ